MTWVRLDDGLYLHPKAISAGVPAMGLWVHCLAYASAKMTDGFVPSDAAYGVVSRRSRLPDDLVRAGLWVRDDALNGWWIHDYLIYNRSRQQILSEREEKRKSGLATAEKRWKPGAKAIAPATPPATAVSMLPSHPISEIQKNQNVLSRPLRSKARETAGTNDSRIFGLNSKPEKT